MKSIRYSVAAIALLVALSAQAAPSHALTLAQEAVNRSGVLFNQTAEERAVTNIQKTIAQKERAKAALEAELAASTLGLGGFTGDLASGQRTIDELNRKLFEESANMTSQEYQATLNSLNRAKSRFVTLGREATWAQHRQDLLLREIERKNQDIAALDRRLAEARPLAAESRTRALADAATDLVLDKAREKEIADRNAAVRVERQALADANRRTSVGYVYESIQRKQGTVNTAPAPYSRASGPARVRQGGGDRDSAGSSSSAGGGYSLDFTQ